MSVWALIFKLLWLDYCNNTLLHESPIKVCYICQNQMNFRIRSWNIPPKLPKNIFLWNMNVHKNVNLPLTIKSNIVINFMDDSSWCNVSWVSDTIWDYIAFASLGSLSA